MAKGKSYPKEYKEEAVRRVATSGKSVPDVAKELGISPHTLYQWRQQARYEGRLPVSEDETPEQKIRRLERELRMVTEERDIIKKAIAYFTQPPKK